MDRKGNPDGGVDFRPILSTLLYFCAVLTLFLFFTLQTRTERVDILSTDDLAGIDFSSAVMYIATDCFTFYPGALYTPADFSSRMPEAPRVAAGPDPQYGTYRLVLNLTPGTVYGLSGYSATFAQTLWVDGVLLSPVGTPGDSAETTRSKSSYFTVYFEAKRETEIIVQWANHVHAVNGQLMPLNLGEQAMISNMVAGEWIRACLTVGCMVTAALFFFGIFLFFRTRPQFLWFSLACLMITVRTLSVDHKLIMTMFPDLSWALAHRLEYVVTIGFIFFFFLYLSHMFKLRLNRFVNLYGIVIGTVCLVLVLAAPSLVYTRLISYLRYGGISYTVAVFFLAVRDMARDRMARRPEQVLILLGSVAYLVFSVLDIALHSFGGRYDDTNLMQVGMMVFVFSNTLALTLNFNRIETELKHARENEREMDETNRLLERLNRIKSDFLAGLSHEMKTPLTVMGSYAGLTLRQIRKGAVDRETEKNLDVVQHEAVRLGRLVEQLKEIALERERQLALAEVDAQALLARAADFCEPICRKNNNTIALRTEPEHFPLRVNADAIFQVLFNLITNANRHMHAGTIVLCAQAADGTAEITVTDTGTGVPPTLLAAAFERGVSGDGSTGLGLAICREIVEEHGGEIEMDSKMGQGTMVRFTLPCMEAEAEQ